MKEGQVRVIKADSLNYKVQRCAEGTSKKTGVTSLRWVDEGFYGAHHVHLAYQKAVLLGLPEDEAITPELFKKTMKELGL